MKILLFLCVGASLVHLGVQQYTYMSVPAPKHLPQQNPNDFIMIVIGVNFESLDDVYEQMNNPSSTFHLTDDVSIFLSNVRSPANKNVKVTATDFKNSTAAKNTLNNYVTAHTSGKIINFFSDFEKNTDAVVISSADKWKVPVSQSSTYTVQLTGEYNAMSQNDLGFTMVEIPKNQYMTTLYIIPNAGKEAAVAAAINKINLDLWRKSLTRQLVNISAPRATLYVCASMIAEISQVNGYQLIKRKYASRMSAVFS
ncbi:hypothetical protein PRIEUP_LOCUS14863 [Pristimantis euphronides]